MSKLRTGLQLSRRSRLVQKERENRKKVIRLSLMKLHLIEDPESWLRRSVLINNTFRSLQKDQPGGSRQAQPGPTQTVQTFSDVILPPQLDKTNGMSDQSAVQDQGNS